MGREGASAPGLLLQTLGKAWAWARAFGWAFELSAASGHDSRHPVRFRSAGRSTAGARTRLSGEMPPAPSPKAMPPLRLASGWIFPSSGVGLCHGEPAYGVSERALIGEESVLKCHGKIYIMAQPLRVLIVL